MGARGFKNLLLKNKKFVQLRYSPLFSKIILSLRPHIRSELQQQREYYNLFFKNLEQKEHTVFDIGANEGYVSDIFLDNKLSVVAVEPDERNINILTERFKSNPRFKLFKCAAGSREGMHDFFIQKNGTAFSTLSHKWKELIEKGGYRFHFSYDKEPARVKLITLDYLIQKFGTPSLIKIDVEGYENEVLKGLSMRVPLLILEANLPEFKEETLNCIQRVHQLDEKAVFIYAASFNFESGHFFTYDEFTNKLHEIKHSCIDVICVMSNYFDFYKSLPI